jgi:uncharacterized membrane protein YdbT with pleckstrin-like domain
MHGFELEQGEQITMVVRRHWALLALRLLPDILLLVAPFVLVTSFTGAAPAGGARVLVGLWMLCLWVMMFSRVTLYYLNAWVITNSRIIDIRQPTFFRREISSFLLDRVQDVTTTVDGLFATWIGFGTLSVETAGMGDKFMMTGVPDPASVRDLIRRVVTELHGGAAVSAHADGV